MKNETEYTIEQGMSTFWYIRRDGVLIAGFAEKDLAERVLKLLIDKLKNELKNV